MRSPYPRPKSSQRERVARARTNLVAGYTMAMMTFLMGIPFVFFGLIDVTGSSIAFFDIGLLMVLGGLFWRYGVQSKLLHSKCICWREVPLAAKYGLWLVWYERAVDGYPYIDEEDAGALPPPPVGR